MSSYVKAIVGLSTGLLIAFLWHFGTVLGFYGTAPATRSELFIRIAIMAAIFLITSVVSSFLVASYDDEDAVKPDEREELITLKAERAGSLVLFPGLLCVIWFAFHPLTPMQTANSILGVIWLSELIKIVAGLTILSRRV